MKLAVKHFLYFRKRVSVSEAVIAGDGGPGDGNDCFSLSSLYSYYCCVLLQPLTNDFNMKADSLLQHNKAHGRYWNMTRPTMNTNRGVIPVERGMPAAQAELNFHE